MIRPLRRRHARVFGALAVVVPAVLVAALAARRPMPLTTDDRQQPAALPVLVLGRDERVGDVRVTVRLTADAVPVARLVLELEPGADLRRPDPLVYWVDGPAPIAAEALPGAQLLGSLSGTRPRRFSLPPRALTRDGTVLVYSLGHRQLLGGFAVQSASFVR